MSVKGGDSVAITDDAFLDWNPVWSPDGNYLYFLSNRSGSMNLWRVPIEEKTGRPLGKPEPITLPTNNLRYLSFSRDGKNYIYNQTTTSTNIFKIKFDAKNELVDEKSIIKITMGSKNKSYPHISVDDKKLVFSSAGDKQEDIFIADADGGNIRQLTNNEDKDRTPRLSPDGKRNRLF